MLGSTRIELGDLRGARGAYEEALPVSVDLGDRWVVPLELAGFAGLAAKTGRPRQALRLAGADAACSEAGEFRMPLVLQRRLDRWLAPARRAAGADTYGDERGRVAAEVLGLTHALATLGTMRHPVPRALRDTVIPVASRITPIQRRAVRRMTHHHVAYGSSRLTRPARRWAGLRPGDRMGDVPVVAGQGPCRLYEALRRGRHALLCSDRGGLDRSALRP
jgi:hypothetical protein